MIFLPISEFSINSDHAWVRSTPPTATMKTAVKATTSTKAGSPACGKASYISAVIKSTERTGVCSWLAVKWRPAAVERIGMIEAAVVKIVVIEIVVTEVVAIDDRSAVGDIRVVIIDD